MQIDTRFSTDILRSGEDETKFEVPPDQEKGMRAELFKHVLVKVLEAKKEVAKLQASVAR